MHAFIQIIKKEKKNLKAKEKSTEEIINKYMSTKRNKINSQNYNNFFENYNEGEFNTLKIYNKKGNLINKFDNEDEFKEFAENKE